MNKSDRTRKLLHEKFPACFAGCGETKRPLRRDIVKDLEVVLPDIPRKDLMSAIKNYTGGPTYLLSFKLGETRIGLEGTVVGYVTQGDVEWAKQRLESLQESWGKQERRRNDARANV